MFKTILKDIFLTVMFVAWLALIWFVLKLEDEMLRSCAIIGLIGLAYIFLRIYAYVEMYQEFKKTYSIMKDINRKRRISFSEGNDDEVLDYTDWIDGTGDDMLEKSEELMNEFSFLPRKKLIRMTRDIERMMKRKYPPI